MPSLSFSSTHPVPVDTLFNWHERPGAINRLTPPWVNTEVEHWDGIRDGDRAVLKMRFGPFSQRWVAVHRDFEAGRQFADYQETGPFGSWEHEHRFEPHGESGSRIIDDIDFHLKGGRTADRLLAGIAASEIERAFSYRHRILGQDLILHQRYNLSNVPLRIGISGSSGLIGSNLLSFLSAGGHEVYPIVRERGIQEKEIYWNPRTGEIDQRALEGLDVVIHLAGEGVAGWRWSSEKKKRIRESRLRGTRILSEAIARLYDPPTAFLVSSGTAVYGSHGSNVVSEASALRPDGFLSSVAKEWEAEADPAVSAGVRTAFLRFGMVLSPAGGMLGQILPLFQSGLGGRFAGDDQWISWISMDDAIGAIYHVIMSSMKGPVNLVAPTPVTFERFSQTLGTVLRRPAWVVVPQSLARTLFGEIAEEILLSSARIHPEYLKTSGYQFMYPRLEETLRHLLGKAPRSD